MPMAMARIQQQANLAICSTVILSLATVSTARMPVDPSPTPAWDLYTLPRITAAPSPDQVTRRLDKRTAIVNSCATGCIASAVTKSTECKLGDTACECQPVNAKAILLGAYNCIQAACGAFVAAEAMSAASAICTDIANAGGSSPSRAAPTHSDGGLDGNPGSGSSGTGASKSGSQGNGNSFGSGSSSSSTSSSSSGLSSGAIAGVAIGAAALVVMACAVLYYVCIQKKRHEIATKSQIPAGNGPPSMASTALVPDSIGKPSAQYAASTAPVGAPGYPLSAPSVSPYSTAMNTVSPVSPASPPGYPGTTELAGGDWHQQQQANWSPPSQGTTVHDPQHPARGFHQVRGQAVPPLQPQEMFSDARTKNELHGQPSGHTVYEMPAKQSS